MRGSRFLLRSWSATAALATAALPTLCVLAAAQACCLLDASELRVADFCGKSCQRFRHFVYDIASFAARLFAQITPESCTVFARTHNTELKGASRSAAQRPASLLAALSELLGVTI